MATNLDLDDKLVEAAQKLGRHKTKREAVNRALDEYVRWLRQQAIPKRGLGAVAVRPPAGGSTAQVPALRGRGHRCGIALGERAGTSAVGGRGIRQAIRRAHLEHGYSLSEIGRVVGLHYSTISRIVSRKADGRVT